MKRPACPEPRLSQDGTAIVTHSGIQVKMNRLPILGVETGNTLAQASHPLPYGAHCALYLRTTGNTYYCGAPLTLEGCV